jgi:YidC/Oxa1 family membrane protein insertase
MDIRKSLLWAVFTISAVLLFDGWQKSNGQPSLFASGQTKEAVVKAEGVNKDLPTPVVGANKSVPAVQGVAQKVGELITLKNDVLELEVDTLGGVISKALLLKHLDENKKPIALFDRSNERQYFARTGLVSSSGLELPNHTQNFSVVKTQNPNSLMLVAEKNGIRLEKTLTIEQGSYVVQVKHTIKNIGGATVDATLYAELVRDGNKLKESSFYSTFTGPAIYTDAEKFHKVDFSDIDKNKVSIPGSQTEGQNAWVAMIQHYFASAWIPSTTYGKEIYVGKLDNNQYRVGVQSKLDRLSSGQEKTETMKLFVGPQEERLLESIAPGLELVKDYGWLTILAKPIFWLLEKIHGLINNWGWSIILLTILIKLAFFPLSAASYKSMARMKEVQPKLLEMKERLKGEPQKLNQAMMEMYRKEKINPLGGCFPVVIQIPVFIALYWVLLATVEMRAAPWLGWITDLAKPDPFYILPVIMAVSMFIQTKLNPTPPDPVQAKVMMFMPIAFSIMFFFFPAGLVLYWVVNNILSIAQQWQINRMFSGKKSA